MPHPPKLRNNGKWSIGSLDVLKSVRKCIYNLTLNILCQVIVSVCDTIMHGAYLIYGEVNSSVGDDPNQTGTDSLVKGSRAFHPEYLLRAVEYPSVLTRLTQS